jgi:hypothetical protein
MFPKARQQHHYRKETHIILGLFISPGIQKQPYAIRVTTEHGPNQRRISFLRICLANMTPSDSIKTNLHSKTAQKLNTHMRLGIRVGPGLQQQAHTFNPTFDGGPNQRRGVALCMIRSGTMM